MAAYKVAIFFKFSIFRRKYREGVKSLVIYKFPLAIAFFMTDFLILLLSW